MGETDKRPSRGLFLDAQHQLRQPLNAISLLVGELRQGPNRRDLHEIIADLRYAVDLSNAWLDALAELERADRRLLDPQIQDVPLQQVFLRLKDAFGPRFAQHGLDFRVVVPHGVVRADPLLLRRTLSVLLDNAAKFTRAGKVLLGCRRAGRRLRIEVWDSGLGIAEDETARVFEPFFRLDNEVRPRERGLGLGLAFARQLAELSGQELTVSTKLGQGSCFALAVDLVATGAVNGALAEAHADLPVSPLAGAEILLLDGPEAAETARNLESWGAHAQRVPAAGLASALAAAPDVVISDLATFESCGGWDLLRPAGRGALPAVILITDRPPGEVGRQAPVHYLKRPLKPSRLRALCHYALSRRAG